MFTRFSQIQGPSELCGYGEGPRRMGLGRNLSENCGCNPFHDLVAEQLSDKDGKVVFRDLMISDYWISTEHAGVSGTVAELLPVADDSGSAWISLKWPEGPIEQAQGIAGQLLRKSAVSTRRRRLWLTDTLTGREVGRTITDKQGRFSFSKQDRGLYVLHIEERRDCSGYLCKIKGRILVEVDPTSKSAEIQRYGLIMTSCGLGGFKEDGSRCCLSEA